MNYDAMLFGEVIYSRKETEIIRNSNQYNDITYIGINNDPLAERKYIKSPNLKAVKDYILGKK